MRCGVEVLSAFAALVLVLEMNERSQEGKNREKRNCVNRGSRHR